jgi:hypothetical protein
MTLAHIHFLPRPRPRTIHLRNLPRGMVVVVALELSLHSILNRWARTWAACGEVQIDI